MSINPRDSTLPLLVLTTEGPDRWSWVIRSRGSAAGIEVGDGDDLGAARDSVRTRLARGIGDAADATGSVLLRCRGSAAPRGGAEDERRCSRLLCPDISASASENFGGIAAKTRHGALRKVRCAQFLRTVGMDLRWQREERVRQPRVRA